MTPEKSVRNTILFLDGLHLVFGPVTVVSTRNDTLKTYAKKIQFTLSFSDIARRRLYHFTTHCYTHNILNREGTDLNSTINNVRISMMLPYPVKWPPHNFYDLNLDKLLSLLKHLIHPIPPQWEKHTARGLDFNSVDVGYYGKVEPWIDPKATTTEKNPENSKMCGFATKWNDICRRLNTGLKVCLLWLRRWHSFITVSRKPLKK